MKVELFDDDSNVLNELSIATTDIHIIPLSDPGPMLEVAYALLLRVFDPAVVDPFGVYWKACSTAATNPSDFTQLLFVAFIERHETKLIVGVISASVMWVNRSPDVSLLAVGNIAVSPRLRSAGFRGVGKALWETALASGRKHAVISGGTLRYSVAEAEPNSLGFWTKLGYRRPEGVRYLQPSLEFDSEGRPIHLEVPETLLILPLDGVPTEYIDARLVQRMILTMYENWCLRGHRGELSEQAVRNIESYVVGQVFARVASTIPERGMIKLSEPLAK